MIPLYKNSFDDARELDQASKWWESHYENVRCRDFIDSQIAANYDGFRLSGDIARDCFGTFGYDRTLHVLANTVQLKSNDGRFSAQNKAWAQGFYIPRPFSDRDRDYNRDYVIDKSHPGLVDLVVNKARMHYAALNLYDHRHRVQGDIHQQDFKGKLLLLRADVLNDSSRTPENQLFLASGGFGCTPGASGRAVFGEFLIDGEKARFERQDFVGICDERYLPDWAQKKLEALQNPVESQDEGESEGMTMGGQ